MMEQVEAINMAYEFIENNYLDDVNTIKLKGLKSLNIDFNVLSLFSPELSSDLLDSPQEMKVCFEIAAKKFIVENEDVGELTSVPQVPQFPTVAQVPQPFTFPTFLVNNFQRVIYLLSVVERASQKEIAEFMKLSKNAISQIFSRPERGTGLVPQGYGELTGELELGNYDHKNKFYSITLSGRQYLQRLAENSQFPNFNSPHEMEVQVFVRFYNLPPSQKINIGDIRVKHINKFYSIEGVVRRKSEVRPMAVTARFECPSCGNIINVLQLENRFKEPNACACGRKGKFKLLSKELKDVQHWVIEDLGMNTKLSEVKKLHVFVGNDLCEHDKSLMVGNRVLITGIISEVQKEIAGVKSISFDIFLEANHITDLDDKRVELTEGDKKEIKSFVSKHGENTVFELANLFAPGIAKNRVIKQALILQLVSKDDSSFSRRLRIHTHMFGDYGQAKTDLALFSHEAAHKSVYVEATKASDVGITASVVKDEFLKSWALEAGAITLAGDGVALIDEIDKLKTEDISSLGEPMEKGTVTVNKASIHQTLPGVARILSCGNLNPDFKGGVVDFDALCLKQHVVDRFDIILRAENVDYSLLAEKMLNNGVECSDVDFVKKFVLYARNNIVSYSISGGLRNSIASFCESVKTVGLLNGVKFGPRLMLSIFRLSVASAKIRLSDKIEFFDVDFGIGIIRQSLEDRGLTIASEVRT